MTTTAKSRSQPHLAIPTIDVVDVQRAADQVSAILRKTSPDSVVGAVLQQTLHELKSLKQSAEGTVMGPYRMKGD